MNAINETFLTHQARKTLLEAADHCQSPEEPGYKILMNAYWHLVPDESQVRHQHHDGVVAEFWGETPLDDPCGLQEVVEVEYGTPYPISLDIVGRE